jgi:hypothetical protein
MLRKTLAAGAIAATALVLVLTALVSKAAPPTPTEDAEFQGKLVWVGVMKDGGATGLMLQKVRVKRLGERAFLVGSYVYTHDSEDFPEMTNWVPVDEVKGLSIYNSRDDAKKSLLMGAKLMGATKDSVSAGDSPLPPLSVSPSRASSGDKK